VSERSSKSTTTTKPPSGLEIVREYFKAFVSGNPEAMQAMRDNAVPGSIAEKYALIQIATSQAIADSGSRDDPIYYSEDGDTIRVCATSPTESTTSTTLADSKDCTVYSDFVVDKRTHKVSDFKADGIDITNRIVTGGPPQSALGATITPVGAYRGVQSDTLRVIFEVAAGSTPVNVNAYSANYITPDGRQVASSSDYSLAPSTEVQPGARVRYLAAFPGVDVGGRLVLPLDSGEPDYNEATVNIPVTNG
jgi:hypothetical protein